MCSRLFIKKVTASFQIQGDFALFGRSPLSNSEYEVRLLQNLNPNCYRNFLYLHTLNEILTSSIQLKGLDKKRREYN